ncbi:MBL fold metallo-hydrolase [Desulfoluna butyratoxydans]|uniref:Metallo-beta-lactamase n=1 Tax=Desulfoluna butyratoxydans TaxID=231438 RepID=A0A4U8YKK2_9BACT|nr:MBL fold metallo-hydrolase [Desulfoluna butyratoxydans]VFQ43997.1 metallo-beta-lactamase [Desulfoluna butyratoxydans]
MTEIQEPENCFCQLASGSKGNALYVKGGETAVLFDCGLSGRELERRMSERDLDPTTLSAVVVSHEHTDHVGGVGVVCRRFGIPLFITEATRTGSVKKLGKTKAMDIQAMECGRRFCVGGLEIHPFSISHDAADTSGFRVTTPSGSTLGIATDLGIAGHLVKEHLSGCNALILESNHDPELLYDNPNYPWPLKQRVRSRVGHLSNEEAATLLDAVDRSRLSHLVLAHLSEENNTPDLALAAAYSVLSGSNTSISVAKQHLSTPVISF